MVCIRIRTPFANTIPPLYFDPFCQQTGLYLAVCTDSVKIHHKEVHNDKDKAWGEVVVLHEHSAKVTDCFWGTDAASLITTSMDRQVKRFA